MPLTPQRKRLLFIAICISGLFLFLEAGARVFWSMRGVPFFTAQRRLYRSFYPGVAELERDADTFDDDCFDLLLLGGSVLHSDYGDIAQLLRERLIRQTHGCVRVHNLSEPAHTSLDSVYKYEHLGALDFDVVVVYHGINEVRANNCTAEQFAADYSHLSWYKLINDYEARANSRWFVAPYTLKFVTLKVLARMGWGGFLPTHEPTPDSMQLGCDVKTAASFRANMEKIVRLAGQRDQPVVLMTFAYYRPDNYTQEAFASRELDYTAHTFGTELWGRGDCVVKALEAHNAAIQAVVSASQGGTNVDQAESESNGVNVVDHAQSQSYGVLLVDQAQGLPREGLYFNDICHLTHEGCERFVENLLPVLLALRKY